MKNLFKKPIRAISLGAVIFSLIFGVSATFAITTSVGYAATSGTLSGLSDPDISLTYNGSADDPWSASADMIKGRVKSESGTCGDAKKNSTLTVKNAGSDSAILSFSYTVIASGGTIKIDDESVTTDGSFSKELSANASIDIFIKSGSASDDTAISISSLSLLVNKQATLTFSPVENGSFSVDGVKVTEEYSHTYSSTEKITLEATPDTGFVFYGWLDSNTSLTLSFENPWKTGFDKDSNVSPIFISENCALFDAGGKTFTDLDKALSYAASKSLSTVSLVKSGIVSGTFLIPKGICLLVPNDEVNAVYTTQPAVLGALASAKEFRSLGLAPDSSLIVEGSISLGGGYYSAGGSQFGQVSGAYGALKLDEGSNITIRSEANLYAWGFVSGEGSVLIESGGTVYECFQILDFRGGSATSSMGNKVFPFSQYCVQNIESKMTIKQGGTEKLFTSLTAVKKQWNSSFDFIGTDSGMFRLSNGSLSKMYDGTKDRLVFDIAGDAKLSSISLKVAGTRVDSSKYVLPITNNMSVHLSSGKLVVDQDTALLAGVKVSVDKVASIETASGKSLYIYDSAEWLQDKFVSNNQNFISVRYAPSKTYNRTVADLTDAEINLNGTLVSNGAIYTTKSGAKVFSSEGTGTYQKNISPSGENETVTYQYNSSTTKVDISITPVQLQNIDETYTSTEGASSGTTYIVQNGFWKQKLASFLVTYHLNDQSYSFEIESGKTETIKSSRAVTGNANQEYAWAWINDEDASKASQVFLIGDSLGYALDLYPVFEGWVANKYYFDKNNGPVSGFFYAPLPNSAEQKTIWFEKEEDARLASYSDSLEGVREFANQQYYVKDGAQAVPSGGWYRESNTSDLTKVTYYYFGSNSYAYKNCTMYVKDPCRVGGEVYLPAGWYTFGKEGFVEKVEDTINPNESSLQVKQVNRTDYCLIDGVKAGIGLFEFDGYVYYAQKDASLFKDGTLFVPNANGITGNDKKTVLVPGLYVFNEKGQMLDGDYQLIHKA